MVRRRQTNPDDSLRSLLRETQQDPTAQNLTRLAFAAKRENQAVVFKFAEYDSWIYRLLPHKKLVSVWGGQTGTTNDWHELAGGQRLETWLRKKTKHKFQAKPAVTIGEVILVPMEVEKHLVWRPISQVGHQGHADFVDYLLPNEVYQMFSQRRQNPDESARKRVRQAKLSKTVEDQAKVLVDRIRSGKLDPRLVELAAGLRDEASLLIFPDADASIGLAAMTLNRKNQRKLITWIRRRRKDYGAIVSIGGTFREDQSVEPLSRYYWNLLTHALIGRNAAVTDVVGFWQEVLRTEGGSNQNWKQERVANEQDALRNRVISLLLWGVDGR